ncbi:hypothetical protein S7711_05212 [Stachybotrys chartarum IBT 7711]|uniref:Uncharacterized protein n=1 Tax=Stachybotrys chartarum (strain CBS 109288 / IBT 7711) TaxID=1280523 RepID=A0A084ANH9_STACB|nr:hypothetical protein S7711_05212 [Stachybotrys chartarum IBT 7711]KFA53155.1 hypothetical protein S40293_03195 [Stachybotrys chartarum IBT 40293]KFA76845.1 hypothetical protein S40288_03022 [Stachybotrys chartarum IBT 40288]
MAKCGALIDLQPLMANSGNSKVDAQLLDVFDKAVNALSPTELSAEATAGELDRLYPAGTDDVENYLWSMWTLLERVAKKVPALDPRQQLLVGIIRKLQAKDRETVTLWGNDSKVWSELPMLGPTMREAWNARPALDGTGQDASAIAEWVSLNSFAARVLGGSLQSWENFAIWELRASLEEDPASSTARDAHLATASQWFIYAGKVLYDLSRNPTELDEASARALTTGKLLDAKPGFSEERWKFWRERLAELVKETESKELRETVDKAIDEIKSQEA